MIMSSKHSKKQASLGQSGGSGVHVDGRLCLFIRFLWAMLALIVNDAQPISTAESPLGTVGIIYESLCDGRHRRNTSRPEARSSSALSLLQEKWCARAGPGPPDGHLYDRGPATPPYHRGCPSYRKQMQGPSCAPRICM